VSGHVDVREQMDAILAEEHKGLRGVSSTHAIILHIANRLVPSVSPTLSTQNPQPTTLNPQPQAPHCKLQQTPNQIDLVDLPGLVATGEGGAETKALVQSHISKVARRLP
jgi:hypothetical protein